MESNAKNLTPKDLAKEFGTDDKTIRRILRAITDDQPGSGARWAIVKDGPVYLAVKARVANSPSHRPVTVATLKK